MQEYCLIRDVCVEKKFLEQDRFKEAVDLFFADNDEKAKKIAQSIEGINKKLFKRIN